MKKREGKFCVSFPSLANSKKKVETFQFKFNAAVEDFEGYVAEFEGFVGDILVEVVVKKSEKRVDVTMMTKTSLRAICDRCLRPCEQEAVGEFSQMYLRANDISCVDDGFVRVLPEHVTRVDIEDDIRETILLSKPIKILCHRFDCEIPRFNTSDISENTTKEISWEASRWREILSKFVKS